ncbi:MAG: sterol desaturase family protein [Pseudomonadota bacterium]
MFDRLIDHTVEVFFVLLNTPVNMGEKFYVVYLATFVALAFVSYRLYHKQAPVRGFLAFLFPKKIYLHKSARIDYGIYLINLLISPLLLVGASVQTLVSVGIGQALLDMNGGSAVYVGEWSVTTYVCFIIGFTLAADFSVYVIHRLHHQSDILWPLHELHHSAEVMTPVTLFRKHPLWNITANVTSLAFTGLFQGLFLFVFYGVPSVEVLFGINTVYVLYNFFGANLRHSHVWLSWGKPLSYIFISPAMHQIHHDPQRMRKNYGEVFAIWDYLFGTLYIPDAKENFTIGLGHDVVNPHQTLWQAYVAPVTRSLTALARRVGRARASAD